MSKTFTTILLAICMAFTLVNTASAIKPGQKATSGNLVIVTESLPDGEATREYNATIEVKGGKAPYTYISDKQEVVFGDNGQMGFTAADTGTLTIKISVEDSSEPALKAEKEFTIKIGPKIQTSAEIISEARNGLAKQSDVADLADNVSKGFHNLSERTAKLEQSSGTSWIVWSLFGVVFVVLVFLAWPLLKSSSARRIVPAVLLAFVLASATTFAAAPVVKSITPTTVGVGQTATIKVCGSGLTDKDDVDFSEPAILEAIKDEFSNNCHNITAKGVKVGEVKLVVTPDGGSAITVPTTIKVVDKAVTSTIEPEVIAHREDLRWHAAFNAVCGGSTDKGRCGLEYQKNYNGDQLFMMLRNARTQHQEDMVMSVWATAQQITTRDSVFNDDRMTAVTAAVESNSTTIAAMKAAFEAHSGDKSIHGGGNGNNGNGISEKRVGEIFDQKIKPTNSLLDATANAAQVALDLGNHGGAKLGFGGGPKKSVRQSASSAAVRLACARHQFDPAHYEEPEGGCAAAPAPPSAPQQTPGVVQMTPRQ